MPIQIFFNRTPEIIDNKKDLLPLLNVLIDKASRLENLKDGDSIATNFAISDSIDNADIYCLPKYWGYYQRNGLIDQAIESITLAKAHNKPIIIFNPGDAPARLPFSGAHVFEQGGYKSNSDQDGNWHYGYPARIQDYVTVYNLHKPVYREKETRPLIGFCGQASGRISDFIYHEIIRNYKTWRYKNGRSYIKPPPFETVKFRSGVLNTLKRDPDLDTKFILRRKFRAGNKVEMKKPEHQIRREFVKNILDTDYTVCMRGGGNFSVRFYETLCLGRIPIFVNTDCLLPFEAQINYKDLLVWVEDSEIQSIGKRILQFHDGLSPTEFLERQQKCRELWIEYFSTAGLFKNISRLIYRIMENHY